VVFAGCPGAIPAFADIGSVAAGKKRGFCRLLGAVF
jgi:hypothetical protein